MAPEILPLRESTQSEIDRDATLWSVFFSLRGSLPREQWCLAMVVASSVFVFVASLLTGSSEASNGYSGPPASTWPLVAWCFAAVCVVTLLCAKRLLDCERPLWLALTVAGPALFMILAFGTGIEHVWSVTTVLAAYSAVFALPALIACAVYDAED